jgi:site-specific DNA-methyltransferase (adenine-specific)
MGIWPVSESFLNGRVTLHCGDCLAVMADMAENSVDSIVCDPPYHLHSIVKRFGAAGAAPAKSGKTGAFKRASAGFMGKQWDGGDIAFQVETWRAALRVLKPGGYIVAFSSSRTFGRMSVAIEDAGFITHPLIGWIFGHGFPKAHRGVIAGMEGWRYGGQALKPALEPIYMGQKPFSEKTGTANALKWRTGALNIDGCRVEWLGPEDAAAAAAAAESFAKSRARGTARQSHFIGKESRDGTNNYDPNALKGRWPANVVHDGSDEVVAAFADTVTSAARFFYAAKADSDDRTGSKHPTVKPLDLMQWLCRLVTPPNGTVFDPFAGTGTTGEAAWREGFNAVLIERESEYQADIRRRMALCLAGPDERARETVKAKTKNQPIDAGPLFGGGETAPPVAGDKSTANLPMNAAGGA